MTNICDNPHCEYHIAVPAGSEDAPHVCVIEDPLRVRRYGVKTRVDRYLYKSNKGSHEFYLCDVCHAAVEMSATRFDNKDTHMIPIEIITAKPWVPPRKMLAEVTNFLDETWRITMVNAGADFGKNYPYRSLSSGTWAHCRPLQDPLIYQFRPHTPGAFSPFDDGLDPEAEVVVVRRNGTISAGRYDDFNWNLDCEKPQLEIIGWLPQKAKQ